MSISLMELCSANLSLSALHCLLGANLDTTPASSLYTKPGQRSSELFLSITQQLSYPSPGKIVNTVFLKAKGSCLCGNAGLLSAFL